MTNSEQLQANNERINAATELLKTKAAGSGSSVEVYDGLDSDSTTAALSANQGRVLNEKIPTDYGADLDLIIDSLTYVITAQLKDKNGAPIGTAKTIDLPLESVVVSGAYDKTTKEVILTLKDNSKINFSVADLVDGLASTSDLNNYLPLSAGASKKLTGALLSSQNIILDNSKGFQIRNTAGTAIDMLRFNASNQIIMGASSSTYDLVSYCNIRPSSIAVNLGSSNNSWTNIYGTTIYQNGKQVANKEDVDDAVATKVNTSDIVNGLASTETTKPLSAMQGKVLNDQLNTLVTEVGNVKEKADKIAVKYLKGAEVQGKRLVLVDQDGAQLSFDDTPSEYLVRATISDNKLTLVNNSGGATVFEGGGSAPTFLFDAATRTLTIITG